MKLKHQDTQGYYRRDVVCKKRLLDRHMRGGKNEIEALEKIKKVDMKNFDLIAQTSKYADEIITG